MARCLAVLPAIVAALVLAPARAQQPGPPAEGGDRNMVICQVSGYDVVIVNSGTTPLAAGIGVAWSVRFARMSGIHVLDADLAPGAVHVLTGALGSSYLSTRTPCDASFAEPATPGEPEGVP